MGYIKLYRKMSSWKWYDNMNILGIWIHLLLEANWEETTYRSIPIPRGSLVTTTSKLAKETHLTDRQVRYALECLEKGHEIVKKLSGRETIITICKYDDYQGVINSDCQGRVNEFVNGNAEGNAEGNTSRAQNVLYSYNLNNNIINSDSKSDKSKEGTSKTNSENGEKEKNTLLSHASHDDVSVSFSASADRIYAAYPASVKRADGSRRTLRCTSDKKKIIRLLKNGHTEDELVGSINTYLSENPGEYTRMLSTFLNNLPDYSEPKEEEKPNDDWKSRKKYFTKKDFEEHPEEFKALDLELRRHLNRGWSLKWENENWTKA